MKRLTIIIVSILSILTISSCTPEEQALWNQLNSIQKQQVVSALNPKGSHRELGRQMAYADGYSETEFNCLDNIINRESKWYVVPNAAGGAAFGIPQAMTSVHRETNNAIWKSSPTLQIEWLLNYIDGRYGDACKAWRYKQQMNWY